MFLFSVINFTPSEPQPILAPSRPLAPSFLRYFTHCSPFLDTSFLRGMECNRENLAIPIIIIISSYHLSFSFPRWFCTVWTVSPILPCFFG